MAASITQLLNQYNVPGPRYTSYPTVPAWTEDVTAAEYARSLKCLQPDEKLSLYFHLPFCERLCHFCGCMQIITKDHSRSKPYVELLLKEIEHVRQHLSQRSQPVSQVHFGGGTPNFLQVEEMTQLLQGIRSAFTLLPDAELAIEMHPRTSTPEFCENLKTLGFNRISLGVQDFNPAVQKLIHRDQTYEMTETMVTHLRKLGFTSFNFDLIYGLPGQTLAGWEDTLEKVLFLKPNRLAVYSYAHVPWVRPVQRSFKDEDLPAPELKLKLFVKAYETFLNNGYQPIGMDHFALEDDELSQALKNGTLHRNFMGYSTRSDAHQIGFGVSSISYVGGNYFQNSKTLPQYEASIAQGNFATFRGFKLSKDDAIRRDLITQIMCLGKVDLEKFEKQWELNFQEYFRDELPGLNSLQQAELVSLDSNRLSSIGYGHLFLRNIAMAFDPYLKTIQSQANNPTFSKTV